MSLPVPAGTTRVVAISGAGRGIGLATARALHASGACVVLGDIDVEAAEAAAAGLGDRALAVRLDVSDADSFVAFVDAAETAFGPLGVLINNAGIMPIGPFLDEAPATAQRALDINMMGCLNGMRSVLPGMLERGRGHIINVASVAGKSPVPGGLTYAATKAGVISMTETARVEYAGTGLAFTCVMPSFTNTELIAGTKGTRFVKNIEPDDVAAAIVAVIARPRPDVFVPKVVGTLARTQPLIGRRVRDRMNKAIKADRTFLEVDQSARAGYDRRIGTTPQPPSLTPGDEA
ncbi:FabG-like 3-oxoacyl-(acyl-carrier-protein) reductase [Paraconexibacter sp. AEG42_29]|uniref:FabG-like 3-oxoacyl-(Acyl-carrier-protein) reductase n=1 Tax=Paraconexibacter sp. AEG42_29 TaxID=2997339 RepID=A0AAU7B1D9_9ACTN